MSGLLRGGATGAALIIVLLVLPLVLLEQVHIAVVQIERTQDRHSYYCD